jgi:hypothetical protein
MAAGAQNTRIRRHCPPTLKINSSPIVGTSRFSSVIACSPFRSVASNSRLRISICCGRGGYFALFHQPESGIELRPQGGRSLLFVHV